MYSCTYICTYNSGVLGRTLHLARSVTFTQIIIGLRNQRSVGLMVIWGARSRGDGNTPLVNTEMDVYT